MDLPFDGAISNYLKNDAPEDVRELLRDSGKKDIANERFPYPRRLPSAEYEAEMLALQIEMVKLQAWVKETGARIALVFEGRDAAGKGGTIKAMTENINPRGARVVALPKPTETEATQWYFQRYIAHMPAAGEIVFFDRSWYNRGVVEHVFDFCTPEQRALWFEQVAPFEKMLVEDGVILMKFWINVGRATQLERFLAREGDPLKQWKLSWIDVEGLNRWDAYSHAIVETLNRSHTTFAPWTVVRGDDKRRARLNAIRALLTSVNYARKDAGAIGAVDSKIIGGPEVVMQAKLGC